MKTMYRGYFFCVCISSGRDAVTMLQAIALNTPISILSASSVQERVPVNVTPHFITFTKKQNIPKII